MEGRWCCESQGGERTASEGTEGVTGLDPSISPVSAFLLRVGSLLGEETGIVGS